MIQTYGFCFNQAIYCPFEKKNHFFCLNHYNFKNILFSAKHVRTCPNMYRILDLLETPWAFCIGLMVIDYQFIYFLGWGRIKICYLILNILYLMSPCTDNGKGEEHHIFFNLIKSWRWYYYFNTVCKIVEWNEINPPINW